MTDEEIWNHIHEACKTPVSSAASDDGDSDVSEMEPLPPADPHCHNEAANNMNDDINDELYIPCNTADHRTLVHQFRNEILHDWIADDRAQLGLFEPFDAHQHDMAELGIALQNNNKLGNKIYISTAQILRHDWDRRADCQCTIEISGRKHRGSGELLNHQFAGVRRAIWQYWKARPRVNPDHINAYVEAHGAHGYFRVVMWHHLPAERWIQLWRQRRISRRAKIRGGGTVMIPLSRPPHLTDASSLDPA
jgi:hypothetical protein